MHDHTNTPGGRRAFLKAIPALVTGAAFLGRTPALRGAQRVEHPDPRPGIDASKVLPEARVTPFGEDAVEAFRMIREIPEIADGIACYCGCAVMPGYRSLLTCYHEGGMAAGCQICQGEARLAHRRHQEGQDLDQIRRAIDARFAR